MTAQTVYLAIGSAYTTTSGAFTELSGNGYARASASATYDPVSGVMTVQGAEFGPATGTWTAGTTLALFDASSSGNMLFAFAAATAALASGASLAIPTFALRLVSPLPTVSSSPASLSAVGFVVGGTYNGAVLYTAGPSVKLSATNTLVAASSIALGLTAHAGGTKAAAIALTAAFNQLAVVATSGDSALLPPAIPGAYPNNMVAVANDGAAPASLYGQGTDTIDGAATANATTLTNAKRALFFCTGPGTWISIGSTKSA